MTTQPTPDNFVETPQEFLSDRSTDPDLSDFNFFVRTKSSEPKDTEPSPDSFTETLAIFRNELYGTRECLIATAQEEALKFIQRLATEDGAIVSSGICTALEISLARMKSKFFVDHEGYGYILKDTPLVNVKTSEFLVYQDVTLHWDGHDYPTKITRRCFDPDSKQWVYQTRQFADLVAASDLTSR